MGMLRLLFIWFLGYIVAMIAGIIICNDKGKIQTGEAIAFVFVSLFSWFTVFTLLTMVFSEWLRKKILGL
jgi:hypothetical protein